MISHVFAIVLLTGSLVSAWPISSRCLSALRSVVESPDSACLNPSGLIALFNGNSSESIIVPLNDWVTGMCALDPCSNATLATITTNITVGCRREFDDLGITPNASALIPKVQAGYPPVRQVFCLKHTSTDTNCVTETLTNIQTITGTLSFDSIVNVTAHFPMLESFPSNVTCTDCIKAAYNILTQNFPGVFADLAEPFQMQCGSSFIDGQTPPDISDSGTHSTTSTTDTSTTSTSSAGTSTADTGTAGTAGTTGPAGATGTSAADTSTTSTNTTGAASVLSAGSFAGFAISILVVVFSGFAFLA